MVFIVLLPGHFEGSKLPARSSGGKTTGSVCVYGVYSGVQVGVARVHFLCAEAGFDFSAGCGRDSCEQLLELSENAGGLEGAVARGNSLRH